MVQDRRLSRGIVKSFFCSSWVLKRAFRLAGLSILAAGLFGLTSTGLSADSEDLDSLSEDQIPPDRVSQPYQPRSLKGLTPERLVKWMGPGKLINDFASDRRIQAAPPPVDIWSGTPESVVRAFIMRKRSVGANKDNPLIIDPATGPLPDSGLIAYRTVSSSCNSGIQSSVWSIRWNPASAWVGVRW